VLRGHKVFRAPLARKERKEPKAFPVYRDNLAPKGPQVPKAIRVRKDLKVLPGPRDRRAPLGCSISERCRLTARQVASPVKR
jgi:hypothetical protein